MAKLALFLILDFFSSEQNLTSKFVFSVCFSLSLLLTNMCLSFTYYFPYLPLTLSISWFREDKVSCSIWMISLNFIFCYSKLSAYSASCFLRFFSSFFICFMSIWFCQLICLNYSSSFCIAVFLNSRFDIPSRWSFYKVCLFFSISKVRRSRRES